MSAVLQAIAFISQLPGSYIYQVILLVVLIIIATRAATSGYSNLRLPLRALVVLRLAALLLGLFTSSLPHSRLVIIPPFDRAVSTLTLFGLIWVLASLPANKLTYGVATAGAVLTAAATVASWVLWSDAVAGGAAFYNGTLQDSLWLTAQLFLLAGGMLALLIRRPSAWPTGIGLMAVLFASEGLHYLFPIANADVPGTVRLAELIVWPLAAAMLLRRLRPMAAGLSPSAGQADAQLATPAQSQPTASPNAIQTQPILLQDQVEAANRRNQQLRTVIQETRQKLQAATSALTENEARLAAANQALEEHLAGQETPAAAEVEVEEQLAQRDQALAEMTEQLRVRQAALAEAEHNSEQARLALAQQTEQLSALQHQLEQKEEMARELRLELKRRSQAAQAAAVQAEVPARSAGGQPGNGANGHATAKPGAANGNGSNGTPAGSGLSPADTEQVLRRSRRAAIEFRPELTPTAAGQLCPHLGLQTDRDTRHAFASALNRCYALPAASEVSFNQQDSFCLGGAHVNCPVFTGELIHPALPIDTMAEPPQAAKPAKSLGQRAARLFRRKP